MKASRCVRSAFMLLSIFALASSVKAWSQTGGTNSQGAFSSMPPKAPVKPVIEKYYGKRVTDPYRYLENLSDPQVQSWMKAQNDYARATLAGIAGRTKLLARVRELDQSVPQVDALRLPGGKYLVRKMQPGENTSKLYVRDGLGGQDRILVDPEKITLAPVDQGKGTNVVLGVAVSDDGAYAVVGIQPGGDELHGELHVFEMATGRASGDVITQVGAEAWNPYWLPDNRSFVYGRL